MIEKRLTALGIELPSSSPAGGVYVPVKQLGNTLFVSGQVPMKDGKPAYTGKIGSEHDIAYGQEAAKLCIVNLLAAVKAFLGDLDKVKQIAKIQVFVNSEVGFEKQHIVANAASQMLVDIFGEAGKPARTAMGTNQLPLDFTVEIEAIIEVREDTDHLEV